MASAWSGCVFDVIKYWAVSESDHYEGVGEHYCTQ